MPVNNSPQPSDFFEYPSNLMSVDLAMAAVLYHARGEITQAPLGGYLCCYHTNKLIKKAKNWFGKMLSQEAWDELLTSNSNGYPLTPIEMNMLGMIHYQDELGPFTRSFIEKNSGLDATFAFMILNDLQTFGFVTINEALNTPHLTQEGEKALHGISKRVFKKRYRKSFLPIEVEDEDSTTKKENQASLF